MPFTCKGYQDLFPHSLDLSEATDRQTDANHNAHLPSEKNQIDRLIVYISFWLKKKSYLYFTRRGVSTPPIDKYVLTN